jgi:hypothetical protein
MPRKQYNYSGLRQRYEDACFDYITRFINKQGYNLDWSWHIPSKNIWIKINEKTSPSLIEFDHIRFDIDNNILPGHFTKFIKENVNEESYKFFLKQKMLL